MFLETGTCHRPKWESDINVRYRVSILAFYLFQEDLTGLVKGLRNIDESIEPITEQSGRFIFAVFKIKRTIHPMTYTHVYL